MSDSQARASWKPWHIALLVLVAGASVLASLDAWRDILSIAMRDQEQSHIFLAPIIAVWMLWVRRIRLRRITPRGSLAGILLVLAGAALSHIGYEWSMDVFWHGGAVLMFAASIVAIAGRHFLFAFLSAFAVLVFMVPVPGMIRETIALPLQDWTAVSTMAVLETIGIEVERTGNVLRVNGQQIAVAEACNGLRMVWALMLVTYAFAFSIPLRPLTRGVLLVMSPFVALLCNIIRLVPTAILYGYAEKDLADSFHDISGWFMLPVAFIGLLATIRLLRWALVPVGRFNLAYQ